MNAAIRVAGVAALLGVFGCDDAVELPGEPHPAPSPPAALVIVVGNNQIGGAGEPLPERLVVRVTDSAGNGVAGQAVRWTVTSGAGFLQKNIDGAPVAADTTMTASNGNAAVTFIPAQLGISTIAASVPGRSIEPVTFSIDASVLVISNVFWGYFLSPDGSLDASVPVGTPVEWVNTGNVTVEIASTAAPADGTSFSARLGGGARFRLVPEVAGTWQWTFRYFDEAGALVWDSEETRSLTAGPGG
ncbi:MAG TPA: hypothetical protein VK912_19185 [Longimicrobiales bacterium]|nr:hypothetical protein [Longimicrobiales bacterium]